MKRPASILLLFFLALHTTPASAYDEENFVYAEEWPFEAGGDFDRARTELGYEVSEQTARIYVPDEAVADDRPLGLYVHLSFNDMPHNPGTWRTELADLDLAYCSPHDAGGNQNLFNRFFRVVDCVASMSALYNIDDTRVVIGGYSAGGVSAVDIVVAWQELFVGVISHARTVPWQGVPISTRPGVNFGAELDRHDSPEVHAGLQARGRRFAFISGEEDIIAMPAGDFSNYEGILKTVHQYWERGLQARVFDVPGMRHVPAAAEPLSLALRYVLSCEDGGEYPPRFDMNHRPPHTPVATPSVMAPACSTDMPGGDAGPALDGGGPGIDAGPGFDGGPGFDAGSGSDVGPGFDVGPGVDGGVPPLGDADEGCGCSVASRETPSPMWLALLLVLGLRRRLSR
ncbi:MAG: MYXO-CTERM sorting domain-containing protein [Polyangiales bacterium]